MKVTLPFTVNEESTVRNQKAAIFILDVKVPLFSHYLGTSRGKGFGIANIDYAAYVKL